MNLLIDVSYIAKKNVWIRSTGESYLSSKEDREDMIQSLMMSINIKICTNLIVIVRVLIVMTQMAIEK